MSPSPVSQRGTSCPATVLPNAGAGLFHGPVGKGWSYIRWKQWRKGRCEEKWWKICKRSVAMFLKIECRAKWTLKGFCASEEDVVRDHTSHVFTLAFTRETGERAWKTPTGFSQRGGTRLQKQCFTGENKKKLLLLKEKCVNVVFFVKPNPFPQQFPEWCVCLKITLVSFLTSSEWFKTLVFLETPYLSTKEECWLNLLLIIKKLFCSLENVPSY